MLNARRLLFGFSPKYLRIQNLSSQDDFYSNPNELPSISTGIEGRKEIFSKYPLSKDGCVLTRQSYLESLDSKDSIPKRLLELHPDIWGTAPRLDIIAENLEWQELYKKVEYNYVKDRFELPDRRKRPWPLKGTGRARHASIRSPIWIQGGKAHGPKGPRTWFKMIPYHVRVNGLIHTLSCKFAQDDIHIVENLEIPSNDPKYLQELVDSRGWNMTALFVDKEDIFPSNITEIVEKVLHINVIPAYGLNVHSMLKHKTLILTLDALNHIEDKLLFALRRSDKYDRNIMNKMCIGKKD